jgi:hypothetical protein
MRQCPTCRRGLGRAAVVLLVCLLAVAPGCGDSKPAPRTTPQPRLDGAPPAAQAPISNTDPCAMRLHDLCGPLLMYYRLHQALPQRLAELKEMPSFGADVELTCPVSKQPYVYNAFGLPSPDKSERVIIYDATPAHSGFRWAVSIIEPKDANAPLITKVIALPESQFQLNIPVNK